jgi:excisionase family DNA binding protein
MDQTNSNCACQNQELMTYKDLAKYLKRSYCTLRHDKQRGDLPFVKLRGSVRFRKSDIDEWIDSKAVKARS